MLKVTIKTLFLGGRLWGGRSVFTSKYNRFCIVKFAMNYRKIKAVLWSMILTPGHTSTKHTLPIVQEKWLKYENTTNRILQWF